MSVVTIVMLVFSVIGAVDRIIGNRFGLGKEYEKGFMLLGNMALSMIGMLVLAPVLANLLEPVMAGFARLTGMDPGVIPASLFANDMGGASLAVEVAKDKTLGQFNGLVVSSMMGCTISYTIPYSLSVVDKKNHRGLFLGILCGLATIPVGCLAGGLVLGIPVLSLLWNMLPLLLFSGLVVLGLLLLPEITVKLFSWLGVGMRALITVGLVLGGLEFLTGKQIVPGLGDVEGAAVICINSAIVLSGAFPLMNLISRLLVKPLNYMGKKLGVNETAVMGLLSSLVTSTTTFEMVDRMDDKGIVVNSAFAVSAAFVLGAHLAFTLAFDAACVTAMMIGKLIAGVLALWLALLMYKRMNSGGKKMVFELLDQAQKEQYQTQMLEMLCYSDREFVPPLSARSSTTQADLSGGQVTQNGVVPYFREMLKQQILGAFEDGVLLAFVSFREDYTNDRIPVVCPNLYLSTLVMRPEARGKHLTQDMYRHLFFTLYPTRHIYTRTWSTNMAHITILGRFGFRELCRLENDRGPGLDTVYFALERT